MKKISKYVKCGCCGEKVKLEMIALRRNGSSCFDGRPVMFPQGLIPMYQCPECYYTRYNIETPASEEEKKYIFGAAYQSRWVEKTTAKKLYTSGAEIEEGNLKIYCHLVLSWFADSEKDKESGTGYRKAVINLYQNKKDDVTIEEAICIIDILRQLEEWEIALSCLKDTKTALKEVKAKMEEDANIRRFETVLKYEEMMISCVQTKPAFIGEGGHIEYLDFYSEA